MFKYIYTLRLCDYRNDSHEKYDLNFNREILNVTIETIVTQQKKLISKLFYIYT